MVAAADHHAGDKSRAAASVLNLKFGGLQIDSMITHVLSLEEINKGFDLMHAGESIRSVVVY